MPNGCENCKENPVDIAAQTTGTPTAKLIAILEAHGITGASALAEIIGISERAVRKARNSGSGTQVPPGTTGPEPQFRDGTTVPKTEPQFRNSGSEPSRAHATKELPSEVSFNKQTNSRAREVGQSVDTPPAELKQAFNGSTENLLCDIQGWMHADRHHAVKWLTTLLNIAGSDAVLAAYAQLLESQTKGKLIANPIRYLGKTAPALKGKVGTAATATQPESENVLMLDGKPFKLTGMRNVKPKLEAPNA